MLDLLREEDIVDDVFILDETLILVHHFPPGTPLLDPTEQKDEAVDRALQRLLQIVNLFYLDTLDSKVFQEQREQAWTV